MAQMLLDKGWTDVRPLLGGFDAWRQAGYPLEARTPEGSSAQSPSSMREIQENLQKAEGDNA